MNLLYFNSHHLQSISSRSSQSDFIECHRDLKNLYADASQIDLSQQLTGFSFVEIFESLASDLDFLSLFKQVDLLIIIYDTPEFDAQYSHIGSYLADRYQFSGNIIDITDQGIFCFFSAMKIAEEYFLNNLAKSACILTFDQSTILTYDKFLKNVPNNNMVGYFFLTSIN